MVSDRFYERLMASESSGNPYDQAKTSSAYGLYQFTKGSWRDLIKRHPELGLTENDRMDANAQQKAIRAFTADNEAFLARKGIDTTDLNVHMAHFLGAGDAVKFLNAFKANPDTPAHTLITPASVAANESVFFHKDGTPKTVGEIYHNYGKRFGDTSATQGYTPAKQSGVAGVSFATPAVTESAPPRPSADTIAASPPATSPSTPQQGAPTPVFDGSNSPPLFGYDYMAAAASPTFKPYPLPRFARGGHVAEPKKRHALPKPLADDEDFAKFWNALQDDPQSVTREQLLSAYEKLAEAANSPDADPKDSFRDGGAVREADGVVGLIDSDTPGTADKVPCKVKVNSYVIPADVVSGLGAGNSASGAKALSEKYMVRSGRIGAGKTVNVRLSGGEYVIPPNVVKRKGRGNIEKGIDHFEELIHRVRQKVRSEAANRKAPIR